MADNKKYFWLKLKEDFFRQKEIKKLRRIAGGDTFTIIYLKMQLLSIKNNGVIVFEAVENDIAEQLCLELDEDLENVRMTLAFLQSNNLIEQYDNEYLLNKVPESIGKESQSAERVRKFREKQNQKTLQCNATSLQSNTYVTKCNTEIEKEIELNIDIEKKEKYKKEKKKSEFDFLIDDYSENEELKKAIYDFIVMRKTIKKPLTTRALKQILNKLDSYVTVFSNEQQRTDMKIKILEQSIENCWQSIYELKEWKGFKDNVYKPINKTEEPTPKKFNVKMKDWQPEHLTQEQLDALGII